MSDILDQITAATDSDTLETIITDNSDAISSDELVAAVGHDNGVASVMRAVLTADNCDDNVIKACLKELVRLNELSEAQDLFDAVKGKYDELQASDSSLDLSAEFTACETALEAKKGKERAAMLELMKKADLKHESFKEAVNSAAIELKDLLQVANLAATKNPENLAYFVKDVLIQSVDEDTLEQIKAIVPVVQKVIGKNKDKKFDSAVESLKELKANIALIEIEQKISACDTTEKLSAFVMSPSIKNPGAFDAVLARIRALKPADSNDEPNKQTLKKLKQIMQVLDAAFSAELDKMNALEEVSKELGKLGKPEEAKAAVGKTAVEEVLETIKRYEDDLGSVTEEQIKELLDNEVIANRETGDSKAVMALLLLLVKMDKVAGSTNNVKDALCYLFEDAEDVATDAAREEADRILVETWILKVLFNANTNNLDYIKALLEHTPVAGLKGQKKYIQEIIEPRVEELESEKTDLNLPVKDAGKFSDYLAALNLLDLGADKAERALGYLFSDEYVDVATTEREIDGITDKWFSEDVMAWVIDTVNDFARSTHEDDLNIARVLIGRVLEAPYLSDRVKTHILNSITSEARTCYFENPRVAIKFFSEMERNVRELNSQNMFEAITGAGRSKLLVEKEISKICDQILATRYTRDEQFKERLKNLFRKEHFVAMIGLVRNIRQVEAILSDERVTAESVDIVVNTVKGKWPLEAYVVLLNSDHQLKLSDQSLNDIVLIGEARPNPGYFNFLKAALRQFTYGVNRSKVKESVFNIMLGKLLERAIVDEPATASVYQEMLRVSNADGIYKPTYHLSEDSLDAILARISGFDAGSDDAFQALAKDYAKYLAAEAKFDTVRARELMGYSLHFAAGVKNDVLNIILAKALKLHGQQDAPDVLEVLEFIQANGTDEQKRMIALATLKEAAAAEVVAYMQKQADDGVTLEDAELALILGFRNVDSDVLAEVLDTGTVDEGVLAAAVKHVKANPDIVQNAVHSATGNPSQAAVFNAALERAPLLQLTRATLEMIMAGTNEQAQKAIGCADADIVGDWLANAKANNGDHNVLKMGNGGDAITSVQFVQFSKLDLDGYQQLLTVYQPDDAVVDRDDVLAAIVAKAENRQYAGLLETIQRFEGVGQPVIDAITAKMDSWPRNPAFQNATEQEVALQTVAEAPQRILQFSAPKAAAIIAELPKPQKVQALGARFSSKFK